MRAGAGLVVIGALVAAAIVWSFAASRRASTAAARAAAHAHGAVSAEPVARMASQSTGGAGAVVVPQIAEQRVNAPAPRVIESAPCVRTLIRGTARDARGVPLEPFEVSLRMAGAAHTSPPSTSDGQGRFTLSFDRLRSGEEASAVLQFRACGHAILEHTLQLRGGEDREVEVVLQPTDEVLSGSVTDPLGKPIAGAEVAALTENVSAAIERVRTDAEGAFALRCSRSAEVRSLRVFHPAYLERTIERGEVGADWSGIAVVLQEGCALSGTVVDDAGRPLAGVQVLAELVDARPGNSLGLRAAACSDAGGAFELTGLPTGPLELRFWRPNVKVSFRASLTERIVLSHGPPQQRTFSLSAAE